MGKLAVVIVAFNHARWLPICIQSVNASTAAPALTVVFVDNASTDNSVSLVRHQFPNIDVLSSPINLGLAGGANLGIRHTTDDTILLINPDVVVGESTISALDEALAADSRIGIAGCKLLYPGGKTIQHAGGEITYPLALTNHFGYGQDDSNKFDEMREVDYVTGAVCAVRRSVLDQVGFFDEGFFPASFEEADLCHRIRTAGYKVVYVPNAVAIHDESATTGKDSRRYYHYYHRNRVRFVLKHYTEAQLWRDFLWAEVVRFKNLGTSVEASALRQAYQDNLDVLSGSVSMFANPSK